MKVKFIQILKEILDIPEKEIISQLEKMSIDQTISLIDAAYIEDEDKKIEKVKELFPVEIKEHFNVSRICEVAGVPVISIEDKEEIPAFDIVMNAFDTIEKNLRNLYIKDATCIKGRIGRLVLKITEGENRLKK